MPQADGLVCNDTMIPLASKFILLDTRWQQGWPGCRRGLALQCSLEDGQYRLTACPSSLPSSRGAAAPGQLWPWPWLALQPK